MSELDKLKDDAEQYAHQHPDQVKEGEQAVEKRLGKQDAGSQQATDDQNSDAEGSDEQGDSGSDDQ